MLRAFARACTIPLSIGLALLLSSCSDEPTQANSPVTPLPPLGNVIFHDTTIQAVSGSSFRYYAPNNGRYNLVGISGRYTAYTLLAFYSYAFTTRDSANVTDAKLVLHTFSHFGDSTSSLSFDVYRMIRPWQEITFSWPDLTGGYYDPSTKVGTFTMPAGPDSQEIVVQLDTAMVRQWMSSVSDTLSKDGIILVPTGSTNVIRGINAFGSDSTYLDPKMIVTWTASGITYTDTSTNAGYDTFVANIDNLVTDPTLLYLQSGVRYRSSLLFDVSFIPRGAFVNSAQMTLQRAPATQLLNSYSIDSVESHLRLSSTDSSQYEFYVYTFGNHGAATPDVFTFDARHLVQSWVRGPNDGVLLTNDGISENSSMDLHTFYSALADTSRRPRLRILYSLAKP